MKKNNVYLKRIFRLLLVSISFPIVWFFLYLNNEGWGTDACPNIRNCIIEFILYVLPLFWLLFSIILFIIDFWKNKTPGRRINTICSLTVCVFMIIDIVQKYIITNHRKDISYNNRCSYITPDFAHKLPSLSMRWFVLSIILWLWSYFCFSSLEWKKVRIKIPLIILWILLLFSWLYCLYNSFGKI